MDGISDTFSDDSYTDRDKYRGTDEVEVGQSLKNRLDDRYMT